MLNINEEETLCIWLYMLWDSFNEFIDKDIKYRLKNNNPIEKVIFPAFLIFSFPLTSRIPTNIMYADMASKFNPTINDVVVVAILLPNSMPILLLKFKRFTFIRVIVSIITAELDWIIVVAINPVTTLLEVEDVILVIFCLILSKDIFIKLLLKRSIE